MIRRRLVVTGRVQGVFYRDWFVAQAQGLGLDGWVRNRADGSVEAVVHGPGDRVDAVVALAQAGSPASRVEKVTVSDDAPAETLTGFAKRPTARPTPRAVAPAPDRAPPAAARRAAPAR